MEVKRRRARALVSRLSSVSEQTRADALSELRLITKQDAESRPLIAEAGAIPYLADLLYSSSSSSEALQDNAAATLLNLSISCRDALMSTRGLLDALSHALRHHSSTTPPSAVQSAAATLHSLLITDDSYRLIIGSKRDILYSLVEIIRDPDSPSRSIKDALKAMFSVALHPLNRPNLMDLGAVPALFSLVIKDGRAGIVEDATAVIAQIAGAEESGREFEKVSGVRVLVDLLDMGTGSSHRIKENAVGALLNLVRTGTLDSSNKVRDAIINESGGCAFDGIRDVAHSPTSAPKSKSKALALLQLIEEEAPTTTTTTPKPSPLRFHVPV
ncbi:hypothetical protein Tsubulata_028881 [Turnera subulata]|uniref:U-box domain-containing protein n=1 Tax=Turnera subulata TaxID=218843 RepID=A0A9Q0GEL9_9ROSI|nr:hypothetical protein Tsubulata_028881 [Turnera subulata]